MGQIARRVPWTQIAPPTPSNGLLFSNCFPRPSFPGFSILMTGSSPRANSALTIGDGPALPRPWVAPNPLENFLEDLHPADTLEAHRQPRGDGK